MSELSSDEDKFWAPAGPPSQFICFPSSGLMEALFWVEITSTVFCCCSISAMLANHEWIAVVYVATKHTHTYSVLLKTLEEEHWGINTPTPFTVTLALSSTSATLEALDSSSNCTSLPDRCLLEQQRVRIFSQLSRCCLGTWCSRSALSDRTFCGNEKLQICTHQCGSHLWLHEHLICSQCN